MAVAYNFEKKNYVRVFETRVIGEWVMAELRVLDEIAYVRFASVYRHFKNIDEFQAEIDRLKEKVRADSHD